jgi:very-short-patch-repair endonuclease
VKRDGDVRALAARQHGVVTRSQLIAIGMSAAAIGRHVKAGRLRPYHAGVYLVGPIEPERAREMAALMAGGRSATVSHTSAMGLWKLLRHELAEPVHVSVPASDNRRRPGLLFHRVGELADDEWTLIDRIRVTTPGRTLVDAAGMLGSHELELAIATAERERLITGSELSALLERYPRRPGVGVLRALLRDGAGPHFTRSEAERQCRGMLRAAGLPPPHANVAVGPYELDLFWPEENVAIEIDGWEFHSTRSRFEGDRRKDNWLRARGVEVIRLTWRQITRDAMATAVMVGQALTLARMRRLSAAAADASPHSSPPRSPPRSP